MKKFVALMLVAALSLQLIACNKGDSQNLNNTSEKQGVNIETDEAGIIINNTNVSWYHYEEYLIEQEYWDPHYNQIINEFLSADDTHVTSIVRGFLINDEGLSMQDENYMKDFCHLVKYNLLTGEQEMYYDLSDYEQYYVVDSEGEHSYTIARILESDEMYSIIYRHDNFTEDLYEYRVAKLDKENLEVIEDISSDTLNENLTKNTRIISSINANGKLYMLVGRNDLSMPPYVSGTKIICYDPETNSIDTIDFGTDYINTSISFVDSIRLIDDSHASIMLRTTDNITKLYVIDLTSHEVQLIDIETAISELGIDINNIDWGMAVNSLASNSLLAVKGTDYIATLNLDTLKFEKLVDLQYCNMNKHTFGDGFGIIAINDTSVVMAHGLYTQGASFKRGVGIFTYSLCDGNPYEGRELLTACSLSGDMSYEECEILRKYNDSQDNIFIAIDNRYTIPSQSEYFCDNENYANAIANVTDQLYIDLISGDGPDIILDGISYNELSSSDALIDMKPYLSSNGILNDDIYYANVFEVASNSNDALYQVPTSIYLSGLVGSITSPSDYDKYGFTFKQYAEIIEDDGYDSINMFRTRLDYFNLLFSNMNELFIQDGRVALDNDTFYDLAKFVNTYALDLNENTNYENYWGTTYSYTSYITARNFIGPSGISTVYGLPSVDGRGPLIGAYSSVGISTSCTNIDGAVDFVLYMLSKDSQELYSSTSVMREWTKPAMEDFINACNRDVDSYNISDPTTHMEYYSFDNVDLAVEIYSMNIDNASGIESADKIVSVILYEEMAPYFNGDKSLDEIIPIAEDRIQTVLDERG